MEESVRRIFGLSLPDVRQASPLTLAFVGDAVHELVVRTVAAAGPRRHPKQLHAMSAGYARASAQARMAHALSDAGVLTEEEKDVLRRGRNAHAVSIAKSASVTEYRIATGWESLIGFLYLSGREERAVELVRAGMECVDGKDAEDAGDIK